jgi:hypothetical protein
MSTQGGTVAGQPSSEISGTFLTGLQLGEPCNRDAHNQAPGEGAPSGVAAAPTPAPTPEPAAAAAAAVAEPMVRTFRHGQALCSV